MKKRKTPKQVLCATWFIYELAIAASPSRSQAKLSKKRSKNNLLDSSSCACRTYTGQGRLRKHQISISRGSVGIDVCRRTWQQLVDVSLSKSLCMCILENLRCPRFNIPHICHHIMVKFRFVADEEDASFIFFKCTFQFIFCIYIKMVGWLVKKKDICIFIN